MLVVLLAAGAGAGVSSLLTGGDSIPSQIAHDIISAASLLDYQQAASTCPGLPWTVLAAIGTVESDNGTSTLPGVQSGANSAGAEGPMQFEPATFAAYDEPVPPGGANPPTPYDHDRRRLRRGPRPLRQRRRQRRQPRRRRLRLQPLRRLRHPGHDPRPVLRPDPEPRPSPPAPPEGSPSTGPSPKSAPPTSGAARPPASASTAPASSKPPTRSPGSPCPESPRTSTTPGHNSRPARPSNPATSSSSAADPATSTHVGLVISPGVMVDAPYTGADVREDTFPTTVGAAFGDMIYVGATRPSAASDGGLT